MNLLYVVHRTPYPLNKGERIRSFHLIRFLAQHASVHLACLADEPVHPDAVATLQRYCRRLAIVPLGRSRWARAFGSLLTGRTVTEGAFRATALTRLLRDWCRDTHFDAAIASASSVAPYLRSEELRTVPAIVDLMDVDSQKWLDFAQRKRGPVAWLYRTEGRRLRRVEQDLGGWARAVTLVSDAETELYRRFCPGAAAHTVAIGVDLEHLRPEPRADEQGCVFVGSLDYFPNVDAVTWFCREIWPEVQRSCPASRIALVGRNPTPPVRALAEVPGVDVVGEVADVRPHLHRAAVVVVPLRIARGLQNKLLEALALGKATVVSPESLKGIRAQAGVHVLTATTPQEWATAVLRLMNDTELRRQLGAAGRRFIEEQHSWDGCLAKYRDLLGLAPSGTNGSAAEKPARATEAKPLART